MNILGTLVIILLYLTDSALANSNCLVSENNKWFQFKGKIETSKGKFDLFREVIQKDLANGSKAYFWTEIVDGNNVTHGEYNPLLTDKKIQTYPEESGLPFDTDYIRQCIKESKEVEDLLINNKYMPTCRKTVKTKRSSISTWYTLNVASWLRLEIIDHDGSRKITLEPANTGCMPKTRN